MGVCEMSGPVILTRTGYARTRARTSLTTPCKDLQLNLQSQSSNDNEHAQQTVIPDWTAQIKLKDRNIKK